MEQRDDGLNEMELNQLVVVKIDCHEAGLNASTDTMTHVGDRKPSPNADDRAGDTKENKKYVADPARTSVVIQDTAADRKAKHGGGTVRYNEDADEYDEYDEEEEEEEEGVDGWSSSEKLDNQTSISKRLILFFITCVLVGVLLVVVVMFNLSEKPEIYSNTTYTEASPGNHWSGWTEWSNCSTTCGPGVTSRYRTLGQDDDGQEPRQTEIEECVMRLCPVVGGLSQWSGWSTCSVTCGPGKQTRARYCTDPTPSPGSLPCSGDTLQSRKCSKKPCPVDGRFSPWTNWGQCSTTCGPGTRARRRFCSNPAPQNGGRKCAGDALQTRKCIARQCPVNGGLSKWTTWSPCEITCGNGTRSRVRSCTSPAPRNGGAECKGEMQEVMQCGPLFCPVDGGFSPWADWEPCTVSCGTGTQSRRRACDSPLPVYGGSNCTGQYHETRTCNLYHCPVHGGLTPWSDWGSCSRSCGAGHRSRSRSCTKPVPQHGGRKCQGHASETQDCNIQTCPVLGRHFGPWTDWTKCSVTCGTGVQFRNRKCSTDDCTGHRLESQRCNTLNCPDEVLPTAYSSARPTSSTTTTPSATSATITPSSTSSAAPRTSQPLTPPPPKASTATTTTKTTTSTTKYTVATETPARTTSTVVISSSTAKPITDSLTTSLTTPLFNTTQRHSKTVV